MRRAFVALVALAALAPVAAPAAAEPDCSPRTLVLSAFPGEIDLLLTDPSMAVGDDVRVAGRRFFVGTLRGNPVVLALSGIGILNAEATAETAVEHFRCDGATTIDAVLFSGVAGGRSNIGDVTVPSRWTLDDGETWMDADAGMLAIAEQVRDANEAALTPGNPPGDVACAGADPRAVTTVTMSHTPALIVGGNGKTADPFGGRRFPCTPGGGDVFGCEPCRAPVDGAPDAAAFATGMAPFLDPAFFFGYFEEPTPPSTAFAAEDMESAAVAKVARDHGLPFLAIRGVSDGNGDPLSLPGFPFQFFAYRQIAADNAARVALAFLDRWSVR